MGLSLVEFLTALLSIVMIDLVLAGDNAIVIGMAARNLPKNLQMKAIIGGTVGAIVIRVLATLAVVWLLQIQGLHLGGGLLLLWIAYKLLTQQNDHNVKAQDTLLGAIATIIVADAAMGLDNVLAIAGASHGNYLMVVLGLLISIPIMVFGSTIIIKFMDKYPVIIDIGAGVIAYTAGKMITQEHFLEPLFVQPALKYLVMILAVVGVLMAGRIKKQKSAKTEKTDNAA